MNASTTSGGSAVPKKAASGRASRSDAAPPTILSWDASLAPLSPKVFSQFQRLVHRESGINLTDAKKALLIGRLSRRLRELALTSFDQYLRLVESDGAELVRMIDSIATNETKFFREPRQFGFLEHELFPRWVEDAERGSRSRRVRVWSAGCSTGEEPFSIAMLLLSLFGKGWDLEVLATDISTKALERARAAEWSLDRSAQIPTPFLRAFMLRGTGPQDGKMKAGPEIRRLVRFERLNLNDESYPVSGGFDLIFCRNVLIYFDGDRKRRVIGQLLDHLEPAGFLIVGHAESLNGITDRVRGVMPCVYTASPLPERSNRSPASGWRASR
jgi:chemotaxis protein methyltransferase CheR